jgi:hypothetical protein
MLASLVKRTGLAARLRAAWRQDVHDATEPLRNEVRRLARDVERLTTLLQETAARASRGDQVAAQVMLAMQSDERDRELVARLPAVLDEGRIAAHVREAVAAARVEGDPCEHIVVEPLLPEDVYALIVRALPPEPFFSRNDPTKQDLTLPLEFGPALAVRAWNFVDQVVAQRILRPIVMQKFDEPLQRHYAAVFGDAFRGRAAQLPQASSGGRLMLRRPGYHLAPHRDPKRSFVTCLLYLARPGDSESYGTQLFRVSGDREADYKQTYYPEQAGARCELLKTVPFRPNTLLAFVNSRGAHGATIPADAPADASRYAYQFYVAPHSEALSSLIRTLPAERRRMWQNKNRALAAPPSSGTESTAPPRPAR